VPGELHNLIENLIVRGLRKAMPYKCIHGRGNAGTEWIRRHGFYPKLQGVSFRSDVWVAADDDLYAIEIGRTDLDKWNGIVPLLHVTFRGGVGLYNGHGTGFESALVLVVRGIVEDPVRAFWTKLEGEARPKRLARDGAYRPDAFNCFDIDEDDGEVPPI
jgi:hypothetical protein